MTHWDSSKRPLFLRTVWRDGYHHVVFDDKENANKSKRRRSSSNAARKSAASEKSCCNNKSDNFVFNLNNNSSSLNFNAKSVKLLLSEFQHLKQKRKNFRKERSVTSNYREQNVTIEITPSDNIKYKDMNKEVTFTSFKSPAAQEEVSQVDQFNNNLTEKVMIWLDLATQNGQNQKFFDFKKRVVTAHAFPISKRNNREIKREEKRAINNFCREEVDDVCVEVEEPLLTSREEDFVEEEVVDKRSKMRLNTAKKQLHIFLPNLPRKTGSESDSLLSSQKSSLVFVSNK